MLHVISRTKLRYSFLDVFIVLSELEFYYENSTLIGLREVHM